MHPHEINYHLRKAGVTQRQIADSLDPPVAQATVSQVISRRGTSDRIMKAVAKAIGRDHREVFSDYYFSPRKRKARLKKAAP